MPISDEMKQIINVEVEMVTQIRKTGMKFDDFTGEFSRYLAQANADKEKLIITQFPWVLMEKYAAYLEILTEERGDRILAEAAGSEATKIFKDEYAKIVMYRNGLILQVKHIIDETKDKKAIAALDKLYDGDRELEIINDIFPLTSIVEEHLDVAATFSPGGINYTQGYLDLIVAEAHEALTLKGQSDISETERSQHVEKLNRLLTLCLNAIDTIKKYAEGAFFTDKGYYTEHYANHVLRERYYHDKREAEAAESALES